MLPPLNLGVDGQSHRTCKFVWGVDLVFRGSCLALESDAVLA